MSPTDAFAFLALFAAAWTGVCWLLAGAGGWRTLARHYGQGDRPFEGDTRRFCRVSFGLLANYGRTLAAGRGPEGIRLALAPLIVVAHPPLLIPWADVGPPTIRGRGPLRTAEFRFARAPEVAVRVTASLAQWLLEAHPDASTPGRSKKALDTIPSNP